jgi:peroxiredoxin Q/BCP
MLRDGDPAPNFTLTSDTGETVRLSDFRGRTVVLYFYPRDDTPGCTKQAQRFRDLDAEFRERGAVVLGVSPDDVAAHRKFKEKHHLPFTLLADPDHAVADAYGVWGERSYAGKTYMGIQRSTFVIDGDGRIAKAMYGVNAERNPQEVLDALPQAAGARAS